MKLGNLSQRWVLGQSYYGDATLYAFMPRCDCFSGVEYFLTFCNCCTTPAILNLSIINMLRYVSEFSSKCPSLVDLVSFMRWYFAALPPSYSLFKQGCDLL